MYLKKNPKTKKLVKIIKGKCDICSRNESQFFTEQMTRGENFIKKGRCKNKHCSSMSSSAWTDSNKKGNILKLHDKCPNPKYNCQKIINFMPLQNMLEGGSVKSKLRKSFRGTKKTWDSFIKPGLKKATPLISAATATKTENPQSAQVTNSFLKSLTGGKIFSLTDLHGNGLRLKVRKFISNKTSKLKWKI